MNDLRGIIKVACRVQEALSKLHSSRYLEILKQLANFTEKFQEAISESKRLEISLIRNWPSAAEYCCVSINRLIADMMYHLTQTRQLIERPPEEITSLSSLFEELKQLQQEFGNVEFNLKENAISIVTEPITLDDIYLGPFKVQLDLKKLSELYKNSPYYCIALDPHPAATNEVVTHPHISDERLCEGEGSAAIRAALEQGRLCDFFTLVNSILTSYSPDGPYVPLDEWDGEPCYECGYVIDSENSYYCVFCDHSYCEECSNYCRSCNETICRDCAGECKICEESICPNCAHRCAECGVVCCQSCLDEDLCPNCKEELENEYAEQRNQTNTNTESPNADKPKTDNSQIKLVS